VLAMARKEEKVELGESGRGARVAPYILMHRTRATADILLDEGIKSKNKLHRTGKYYNDYVYLSVPAEPKKICLGLDSSDYVFVASDGKERCYEHVVGVDNIFCGKGIPVERYYHEIYEEGEREFHGMAEVLIRNHVEPNKIIGYAKTEKCFLTPRRLSSEESSIIEEYLNRKLRSVTLFSDNTNVKLYHNLKMISGKPTGIYVKVIMDKEKSMNKRESLDQFFKEFDDIDDLLSAAYEYFDENTYEMEGKQGTISRYSLFNSKTFTVDFGDAVALNPPPDIACKIAPKQ
jgi:hypothetical protein